MKLRVALVALALAAAAPDGYDRDIVVQPTTELRVYRVCPCTWGITAVMAGILAAGIGYGIVKQGGPRG
jgi:hypothetical protein